MTVTTGGILRALVVDWQPPSNPGGIITTYMVTNNGITISTSNTMYIIIGLDAFTNYTISVTACTDNGCGNQTSVVIGTTAEEGMKTKILVIEINTSYKTDFSSWPTSKC